MKFSRTIYLGENNYEKKSKLTGSQIILILKQDESGVKVTDLYQEHVIISVTLL